MENELIPAFKDTILNPIASNMGDTHLQKLQKRY